MSFRRTSVVFVAILAALCSQACARRARTALASIPSPGTTQTGIASWYGEPYHGRRAANGEVYDMRQLTAAHRDWPFGLMVRVRNLSNQREVDVRITDRGPFVDGRIIDLSRAAAERIAMISPGTAKVKLTVLGPAPGAYAVQTGAFLDKERAEQMRRRMERAWGRAVIRQQMQDDGSVLYKVWVREGSTWPEARKLAAALAANGAPALVVRSQSSE